MANFTKQAIKASFMKLLSQKPLNKISVRDIVEDCGINRNSFYYHFQDIPSLLGEIVTEQTDQLIRHDGGRAGHGVAAGVHRLTGGEALLVDDDAALPVDLQALGGGLDEGVGAGAQRHNDGVHRQVKLAALLLAFS